MGEAKEKIRGELKEFLKELIKRMKGYEAKGISESDTKAKLIEPLFEKLGWDTRGEEVIREYTTEPEEEGVDYLFKVDEEAQFLMEARRIGASLEDEARIIEQGKASGISWCVFTDGDKIKVYNSNWPGGVKKKKFFEVSLEELSRGFSERFDNFFESIWLLSRESIKTGEIEKEAEREYAKCVILEILKDEETIRYVCGRARFKRVKEKTARGVFKELEVKETFPFPLRPPEEVVPKEEAFGPVEVPVAPEEAPEEVVVELPPSSDDIIEGFVERIHDDSIKEAFKTARNALRRFGRDVSEEPSKRMVVYKVKNKGFGKLHPYRNYFEISIFNPEIKKWLSFDVELETLDRLGDRIDKARESYRELRKKR